MSGSAAPVWTWMIPAIVVVLVAQAGHAQNLLSNPGFETAEPTSGSPPSTTDDWQGDMSSILAGTQQGIDPASGGQMLHCIATNATGPSGGTFGCQLWQLVDLSAFAGEVATGRAIATASYVANRVAGDAETDTLFSVQIQAHTGSPTNFPNVIGAPLSISEANIETDADLATWESVTTVLQIPTGATYLAFEINVIENIFNDATLPELDGHYVDDASLQLAVEAPALGWWATTLLVTPLLLLLRQRSRGRSSRFPILALSGVTLRRMKARPSARGASVASPRAVQRALFQSRT